MRSKRPLQLALYYALPFVLVVTALFLFLIFWEKRNLAEEQREHLTHTSEALLEQMILTRNWNAQHGGVYVETNARTPPNPYLDDPERDIVSTAGKKYTKLNPAYMTREIATLARSHLGVRYHLTSLRPLNPANRPDRWEASALRSFEQDSNRQSTMVRENGKPFFRYMVPLLVEPSCLKCHAKQQYQVGDVRGGISVTIPMAASDRIYGHRARTYLAAGSAVWLSIVLFIVLASYTLSRRIVSEMTHELELSRLKTSMELAGTAAHEIRQPLTALLTYFDLLKLKLQHDPELLKELDMMALQCRRIDDIIVKMQTITEYHTKTYVNDIEITDLDAGRRDREA